MVKNNYLKILKELTKSEIKEFGRYLLFAFPRSKAIYQIHEYYAPFAIKKKKYPTWDKALIEIFPKENTKLSKLQNYLSDLFLKLKLYLTQKKHLSDKFEQEFLWLQILEEKGMFHEKDLQLKKTLKTLEEEKFSFNTPYQEFQIQKFQYFTNQNVKREKSKQMLIAADTALDEFYFNAKLGIASEMKSMKHVYGISVHSDFFHPILVHLDNQKKSFSILNQFYLLLYQFNANQNENTYGKMQAFLLKYEEQLPKEEEIAAIIGLINYTAGKIKESGIDFIQKAFQLYQLGLKKGVFLYQGMIDNRHYENIINLACRAEKFEWAKKFCDDYKESLPISIKGSSYKLGKAIIAFSQKNFQEVITLLHHFDSIDIYQNLRFRTLLLVVNFELKEDMYLKENCESFERFIRRNKQLGEQNTRAALNFSSILKRMLKENNNKNELKKMIVEANPLFYRSWFLSKL